MVLNTEMGRELSSSIPIALYMSCEHISIQSVPFVLHQSEAQQGLRRDRDWWPTVVLQLWTFIGLQYNTIQYRSLYESVRNMAYPNLVHMTNCPSMCRLDRQPPARKSVCRLYGDIYKYIKVSIFQYDNGTEAIDIENRRRKIGVCPSAALRKGRHLFKTMDARNITNGWKHWIIFWFLPNQDQPPIALLHKDSHIYFTDIQHLGIKLHHHHHHLTQYTINMKYFALNSGREGIFKRNMDTLGFR